jgi:hypothetical protein
MSNFDGMNVFTGPCLTPTWGIDGRLAMASDSGGFPNAVALAKDGTPSMSRQDSSKLRKRNPPPVSRETLGIALICQKPPQGASRRKKARRAQSIETLRAGLQ